MARYWLWTKKNLKELKNAAKKLTPASYVKNSDEMDSDVQAADEAKELRSYGVSHTDTQGP